MRRKSHRLGLNLLMLFDRQTYHLDPSLRLSLEEEGEAQKVKRQA